MNPFTHCCLCILQPFLPDNSSFRIVVVTTPGLHFGWINSHRKQLMRLLAEPLLDQSWFSTGGPGRVGSDKYENMFGGQCLSFPLIISIVCFRNWRSIIPKTAGEPYMPRQAGQLSRRNNGLRLMILIFAGWSWYWSGQECQRRELQLSKFFPQSLVKKTTAAWTLWTFSQKNRMVFVIKLILYLMGPRSVSRD